MTEENQAKMLEEKENQAAQALIAYRTTHERKIADRLAAIQQNHLKIQAAFNAAIARNSKQ